MSTEPSQIPSPHGIDRADIDNAAAEELRALAADRVEALTDRLADYAEARTDECHPRTQGRA